MIVPFARRIPLRQERYLGIFRRRVVQVASLVALHSSVLGFDLKWICNPVLSCHGCALSWFACPIGLFVHYAGYRVFPLMGTGFIVVVGATLGRFLCGWVCPLGLVQDALYKIPAPKIEMPEWTRSIKYMVLAVFVGLMPFLFGESTLLSFCRFCPSSALQVTIPALFTEGTAALGLMTILKLAILAVVLCLSVVNSRFFCRVLCPIWAMLAPFNLISWIRVGRKKECVSCSKCDAACPVQIEPLKRIARGLPANRHPDCLACRDCVSICSRERRAFTAH
jgi:ferredoxin-type protein NapH